MNLWMLGIEYTTTIWFFLFYDWGLRPNLIQSADYLVMISMVIVVTDQGWDYITILWPRVIASHISLCSLPSHFAHTARDTARSYFLVIFQGGSGSPTRLWYHGGKCILVYVGKYLAHVYPSKGGGDAWAVSEEDMAATEASSTRGCRFRLMYIIYKRLNTPRWGLGLFEWEYICQVVFPLCLVLFHYPQLEPLNIFGTMYSFAATLDPCSHTFTVSLRPWRM